MTVQRTFLPWHKSEVVRAYFFVIEGGGVSGKIMRFIVRLKRIPRLFVVWHGKSSVVIILSELIIPFFNGFSSRNTCNAHGFMLYCMQMRRYGQIDLSPRCHYHQVLVGATRWRFKSSCPHHQKALKTLNFQGFLVFSFCSYTAVGGGRRVYDVKSTNRNLSTTPLILPLAYLHIYLSDFLFR